MDTVFKPLLSAAAMAVTARFGYSFLINYFPNILSTAFAICAAGIVYLIVMFLLKAFRKSDVELMPKGDRLAVIMERWLG